MAINNNSNSEGLKFVLKNCSQVGSNTDSTKKTESDTTPTEETSNLKNTTENNAIQQESIYTMLYGKTNDY